MSLFSYVSPSAIIELLIVLGIMVLVHEFGHFAVAKLCGIRVETFSIGFGRRLLGFRRGDTDYRLSLLPLGGYVKMAGDTPGEAPSGDPGEFNAHPRWQRILVALAGPIANFILALVMMTVLYMFHYERLAYLAGPAVTDYISASSAAGRAGLQTGDTIVHFAEIENPTWEDINIRPALNLNQTVPFSFVHDGKRTDTTLFLESKGKAERFDIASLGLNARQQNTPIQIGEVDDATPAQRAGLKINDVIASIDGVILHSQPAMSAYLQDHGGKPAQFQVVRGGNPFNVIVNPEFSDSQNIKAYKIGVRIVPPPVIVEKLSFAGASRESADFFVKNSLLIRDVLKGMFTRHVSVKQLSGPIGIGQQVHEAFQTHDPTAVIGLMAAISINLGIFNLLPIPILDGGMILFLLIESIFRRDINQVAKERIYQAAFVCLLCFAAFVIFNDLTKLTSH